MATACLRIAPDTWQSQIEKPRFETETFVLNWDFHILIIPNKCSESFISKLRSCKIQLQTLVSTDQGEN